MALNNNLKEPCIPHFCYTHIIHTSLLLIFLCYCSIYFPCLSLYVIRLQLKMENRLRYYYVMHTYELCKVMHVMSIDTLSHAACNLLIIHNMNWEHGRQIKNKITLIETIKPLRPKISNNKQHTLQNNSANTEYVIREHLMILKTSTNRTNIAGKPRKLNWLQANLNE